MEHPRKFADSRRAFDKTEAAIAILTAERAAVAGRKEDERVGILPHEPVHFV